MGLSNKFALRWLSLSKPPQVELFEHPLFSFRFNFEFFNFKQWQGSRGLDFVQPLRVFLRKLVYLLVREDAHGLPLPLVVAGIVRAGVASSEA